MVTSLSMSPRFPELESPGFSKALRTAAFAYPFLFDNLPLFYRVRLLGPSLFSHPDLVMLPQRSSCSPGPAQWWPPTQHPYQIPDTSWSPLPETLSTSHAFPLPAGAMLGQGSQLWTGGAEHQPWLPPPLCIAHWLPLRLPPARAAGAWTL